MVYYTARLNCGRFTASLAALLWMQSQLTYKVALSGMEYSLHALCMVSAAYVYLRWFGRDLAPRLHWCLVLGVLLSLTFLARIDTLVLGVVLGLWLLSREMRTGLTRASLRRMLAFGLPLVDLAPCVGQLDLIWSGLGYPNTSRRAAAFAIRPPAP